MKFTIEHLSKSYDKKQVLRDIDFIFEAGKGCAADGKISES